MEINAGKFLTFLLSSEEYGISIKKVKEIIGIMSITHIPKMPEFLKGVINLRGKIIPVVDLRLKFDMEPVEYNQRTCIIVVELIVADEKKHLGVIIDTVSEVVNVSANDIESAPQYGAGIDSAFLLGLGKVKGKVILLLDIERILSIEEISIVKSIK